MPVNMIDDEYIYIYIAQYSLDQSVAIMFPILMKSNVILFISVLVFSFYPIMICIILYLYDFLLSLFLSLHTHTHTHIHKHILFLS